MTPNELRKLAFRGRDGRGSVSKTSLGKPEAKKRHSRPPPSESSSFRSLALMAAILGLTGFIVASRNVIVAQWTPSASLFAAIGAPVNLRGLEITNLRSELLEEEGIRILTVEGDITNLSRSSLKVPELDMNVRGSMARALYSWRAPSPKTVLQKGESVTFRTRLTSPPPDAADVRVRFSSS